ncbi:hypothetical protein TNCV_3008361 [Trichonephila clavipes]|nr:hypothetical protein TNCV_3008361 [Trichonephila clavipes]
MSRPNSHQSYTLGEKKVLRIAYAKGVQSSQFTIGNSTPSLSEIASSTSTVRLLLRNLHGSKSNLIHRLPGITDSQVYRKKRGLNRILSSQFLIVLHRSRLINLSFLTITYRLTPLISLHRLLMKESAWDHIVSSIFSDALSSPIREKTKAHCTGISFNFRTVMGKKGQNF